MIWLIFGKSVVAQTCGNHLIIFPPQQRMLASHPTYSLLGFSAALAPKFTLCALKGRICQLQDMKPRV